MTIGPVQPIGSTVGAELIGMVQSQMQGGAQGRPQAGQMIRAVVMAQLEDGLMQIATATGPVTARADQPLPRGATIDVAVDADPAADGGLRFTVRGEGPPAQAQTQAQAQVEVSQTAVPVEAASVAEVAPETETAARARVTAAATQAAAPRQTGLAPLMADLWEAVALPATPQAVRTAAAPILAQAWPLDAAPTGPNLKQALSQSGLFLERRLAAPPPNSTPSPPVAGDMKAALLVLGQVLKTWQSAAAATDPASPHQPGLTPAPAAAQAPRPATAPPSHSPAPAQSQSPSPPQVVLSRAPAPRPAVAAGPAPAPTPAAKALASTAGQAASLIPSELDAPSSVPPPARADARDARGAPARASTPPPPFRDGAVAAQAAARSTLTAEAEVHTVIQKLVQQTGGALARQELMQIASLPEQGAAQRAEPGSRWMFEIPFAAPQGPAVAQFEISRDGRGSGGGAGRPSEAEPVWRARFSIDIEPMGPVHVQVALSGARAQVALWAERAEGLERLRSHAALLNQALSGAELTPEISLHAGAPIRPAPRSGQLVDVAS